MGYYAVIGKHSNLGTVHTRVSRMSSDEPMGGVNWGVVAGFQRFSDAHEYARVYRRVANRSIDARYLMEQVAPVY